MTPISRRKLEDGQHKRNVEVRKSHPNAEDLEVLIEEELGALLNNPNAGDPITLSSEIPLDPSHCKSVTKMALAFACFSGVNKDDCKHGIQSMSCDDLGAVEKIVVRPPRI